MTRVGEVYDEATGDEQRPRSRVTQAASVLCALLKADIEYGPGPYLGFWMYYCNNSKEKSFGGCVEC